MTARIAVFASGGGTNLQALLDHFGCVAREAGEVVLVVSDREEAGALERARAAGVARRVVRVRDRVEAEVARETLDALDAAGVELVALAGYLRRVPPAVVRRFRGRMVNIHPALLPAFGGKGMYGDRIHRAVLERGCRITGVSVHLVDEEYDTGPILIQWPVPVLAGDSAQTLAARVLEVEHRVYPLAVEALALSVTAGAEPKPFTIEPPAAFRLAETGAPPDAEVRRVLGI